MAHDYLFSWVNEGQSFDCAQFVSVNKDLSLSKEEIEAIGITNCKNEATADRYHSFKSSCCFRRFFRRSAYKRGKRIIKAYNKFVFTSQMREDVEPKILKSYAFTKGMAKGKQLTALGTQQEHQKSFDRYQKLLATHRQLARDELSDERASYFDGLSDEQLRIYHQLQRADPESLKRSYFLLFNKARLNSREKAFLENVAALALPENQGGESSKKVDLSQIKILKEGFYLQPAKLEMRAAEGDPESYIAKLTKICQSVCGYEDNVTCAEFLGLISSEKFKKRFTEVKTEFQFTLSLYNLIEIFEAKGENGVWLISDDKKLEAFQRILESDKECPVTMIKVFNTLIQELNSSGTVDQITMRRVENLKENLLSAMLKASFTMSFYDWHSDSNAIERIGDRIGIDKEQALLDPYKDAERSVSRLSDDDLEKAFFEGQDAFPNQRCQKGRSIFTRPETFPYHGVTYEIVFDYLVNSFSEEHSKFHQEIAYYLADMIPEIHLYASEHCYAAEQKAFVNELLCDIHYIEEGEDIFLQDVLDRDEAFLKAYAAAIFINKNGKIDGRGIHLLMYKLGIVGSPLREMEA